VDCRIGPKDRCFIDNLATLMGLSGKPKQGSGMANRRKFIGAAVAAATVMFAASAGAQETKHFRFAHDQQLNTGYSVAYDMFSAKLKELSKGTMLVDQYPGAQLGQEPQLLQLVKSGDIDFAIVSSANTATISPQAGVMSLHFLFRSADHLVKSLADQRVIDAIIAVIASITCWLASDLTK